MAGKNKKQRGLSLKQQLIKFFSEFPVKSYNYKQLCSKLSIYDNARQKSVLGILEVLKGEGLLIEVKKGSYKYNSEKSTISSHSNTIVGTVEMKSSGKAYIVSEKAGEDIYIAPNNVYRALDNDIVRVRLFPKRFGRKPEGEIIEIIERRRKRFVGIVNIGIKMAFLTPDDPRITTDIIILPDDLGGAVSGIKAVAELTEWPKNSKNPLGKIVHILGFPGKTDVEMQSILLQNDFSHEFDKNTLEDAEIISEQIPAEEFEKRRDFRSVFTITIDPDDAKDFDDAVSVCALPNGNFEVGIHIADVSYYVKEGTSTDKEAYQRGTSVYLVDRVMPMLPERLSNNICSLQADKDKLCFSAVFEINTKGKIFSQWLGKTIINSDIRFDYEQVQKIIEGEEHTHKEGIMILHNIATALRTERLKNGAINFRSKEIKFVLDQDNIPIKAVIKEQKESNHLIEEFMLLANRKVAEFVSNAHKKNKTNNFGFVYRIHDEPSTEKLLNFAEFVAKLGYKLDTTSRKKIGQSFNILFENIAGKPEENMIETIAMRTMAKAVYSVKNIGHYGLGFVCYTHFTSPIRRYPDLIVHRILHNILNGGNNELNYDYLEKICKHCTMMERKANDAEYDSIKYKQMEYMSTKIGEIFHGIISGVSKWGIYVEIDAIKAEGMVKISSLMHDFFYLDEENYSIIGYRTGQEIRLGDNVSVVLKSVNLSKKQMFLELVSHKPLS